MMSEVRESLIVLNLLKFFLWLIQCLVKMQLTQRKFSDKIDLTGIILTRVDGDGRGGAALSMREVPKKPIKFIGVGEKIGDIEIFHPRQNCK